MFKNIRIHYFTGTGNSLAAVNLLAAALKKKGSAVSIVNIEKTGKPSAKKTDLEIFAFPVLGFSAPHIVTRYMKRLPKCDGTAKAAVLAVPAGWPGRTNQQIARILTRRGYDIVLSDYVLLPNNWSQISGPYDEKTSTAMIKAAPKTINSYVSKLAKGTRYNFRISPFKTLWTTIIGTMFLESGRFFMGYLFTADNKCNRCGICVKSCPTKNIRFPWMLSSKPYWGINCENCNRCINICPKTAIQSSILALVAHVAFYIFAVFLLIEHADSLVLKLEFFTVPEIHYVKAGILVAGAVLIVLADVLLLNRILFALSFIPGMRTVTSFGWTKFFARYKHPAFNPLKK